MVIEGLGYLVDPNNQLVRSNGSTNVAGIVRVYYAGTDDAAITYCDFNGTRNPANIRLDNNGRAIIIADVTKAYRVEVRDSNGGLLWTVEPAYCSVGSGGGDYNGIVTFDINQPNLYNDTIQCLNDGTIPVVTAGVAGYVNYYYYTSRNDTAHTITFTSGYGEKVELLTVKNDNTHEFIEVSGKAVIYKWSDITGGGGYSVISADVAAGKQIFVEYEPFGGYRLYAQMVMSLHELQTALFAVMTVGDSDSLTMMEGYQFTVAGSSATVASSRSVLQVQRVEYTDGSEITGSVVDKMLRFGGGDMKRLVVLDKKVEDNSDPDIPAYHHTILYPCFDINNNKTPDNYYAQDWKFRSIPDADGVYYEVILDDNGFVSETEHVLCNNVKVFTTGATFNDIDSYVNAGGHPFLEVSGQMYTYVGYSSVTYGHMFCSTRLIRPMYPGFPLPAPFCVSRTDMYYIKSGNPWAYATTNNTPAYLHMTSGTPSQSVINDLVVAFHAAHDEDFEIGAVTWRNSDASLGWTGERKYIPVYCSKPGTISSSSEHVDFVLVCADDTGIHLITLTQDVTNTFTTTDIPYGGGSFDYSIFATDFDDTEAYLAGQLVNYNNKLYRFVANKSAGAWDSTKVTQDDVDHNLGRISDAGEIGVGANGYWNLKNNSTHKMVHTTTADIVMKLEIDYGEVPNFVAEVNTTSSVNCYIMIERRVVGGLPITSWCKYSNDAGEVLPAGTCQITCVGDSWTWAQFTQSSGPQP